MKDPLLGHGKIPGTNIDCITEQECRDRFAHYKTMSDSFDLGHPLRWDEWPTEAPVVSQCVWIQKGVVENIAVDLLFCHIVLSMFCILTQL